MDMKSWLAGCPLIAVLRGIRPDEVEAIGAALADAGIAIIEVPLNSPDPMESIRRLASRFGDRQLIGAGTVMRPAQVAQIAAVGGRLIVTPHADASIVRAAKAAGLLSVPGFFTPAEAFSLLDAGADALKLFPAEGTNPPALKAMRAVLPRDTLVLPVGGIGADNMRAWLAAGAAGFGTGSSLYKPGDDPGTVARKAKELLRALTDAGVTPPPATPSGSAA
jgi:2-dehydro-3-deoxyphosphogalactonate aldolase